MTSELIEELLREVGKGYPDIKPDMGEEEDEPTQEQETRQKDDPRQKRIEDLYLKSILPNTETGEQLLCALRAYVKEVVRCEVVASFIQSSSDLLQTLIKFNISKQLCSGDFRKEVSEMVTEELEDKIGEMASEAGYDAGRNALDNCDFVERDYVDSEAERQAESAVEHFSEKVLPNVISESVEPVIHGIECRLDTQETDVHELKRELDELRKLVESKSRWEHSSIRP